MSAAADPYVKVYYLIADDERFERVYNNDAALATWLRLLLLADGMWPASAHVPQSCRKSSLALLVEVGLVELSGNGRFRIHGMDAERTKRSEHSSQAAKSRWSGNAPSNAKSNAASNAQTMPLRTEQNRTTQNSSSHAPAGADKHGSKNLENDEERMARYLALRDDPSKSADIRYAAENEVKRLEALRLN
jgi:hypothetical protein